jgi:ribosomal protein L19
MEKIKIIKSGHTRRAKLYYLRKRIGSKALKIEELEPAQQPASK